MARRVGTTRNDDGRRARIAEDNEGAGRDRMQIGTVWVIEERHAEPRAL